MPKNRKKFMSNPDFVEQAKAEFGVKPTGAEANSMYRSRRQMDTEKPAAFYHNLGYIQDFMRSNPDINEFLSKNSAQIPSEVHDQVTDQILATIAQQEADKMYHKDASNPQPLFRMGLDDRDKANLFAAVVTEYSLMQNAYLENAQTLQQISAAQTAIFKLDAGTRTQITNEAITDFLLTPKKYQTPESSVKIAVASELIIPAIEKARQHSGPDNKNDDVNKSFRTETKKLLHIKKGLPAILKEYKNFVSPEDRALLTKPPTVAKKIIGKVAPIVSKPAREPAAPHDNTRTMARIDAGLEEGQHMLSSLNKWNKELPGATPEQQAQIRENVSRVTGDLKELRETMGRITTSENSGFSGEEKAKASAVYHQFMSVTTSVKEMTGTVNDNLAKLAQGGKVAPTIQVSSAELLANPRALADRIRAAAEANSRFSHQTPVSKPEAIKTPAQPTIQVHEAKIEIEKVAPLVSKPAREPAALHDNTSNMARIDAGLKEGQRMLSSLDKWNKELPGSTPEQQIQIRENVSQLTGDLKELRETMGQIITSKDSGFSLQEKAKASAVYHQFMSVTTSVKEMTGTVNDNLAILAQGGKVAPTIQVSSAELLANPRALADKIRAAAEANSKLSHQAPVIEPAAIKTPAQPTIQVQEAKSQPVEPTIRREVEAKPMTPGRPPVIPPRPKGPIQVRGKENSEPAPQVEEPKGKVTVTHLQDIRTQFHPEEKKPAPPLVTPTVAAAPVTPAVPPPVIPSVTAAPATPATPPEKKIVADENTVIPRVHDENILEKGEVKARIAAFNAEAAAKKTADTAEVKPQENQPLNAADIIAQARLEAEQRTPKQHVRLDPLDTKVSGASKPLPSIDGAKRAGRLGPLSMPEKPIAPPHAETAAPITPPPGIVEPAIEAVTPVSPTVAADEVKPAPLTPVAEDQAIRADEIQPEIISPAQPTVDEVKPAPVTPVAEAQAIKADEIQPEIITPVQPTADEVKPAPLTPVAEDQAIKADEIQPEIISPAQPTADEVKPAPLTPVAEAQAIKADEIQPEIISPAQPTADEVKPAPVTPVAEAQAIKADEIQPEIITPAQPTADEVKPAPVTPVAEDQAIKADEIQPEIITPAELTVDASAPTPVAADEVAGVTPPEVDAQETISDADAANLETHPQAIPQPDVQISTGSAIQNTPQAITLAPAVPLQTATAHETETPTPTVASVTGESPAIEISTGFTSEAIQGKITDSSSTATLHETPSPSQATLGEASAEPKPEAPKEGRVAAAVRVIEEGLAREKSARDLESAGVLPPISSANPSKPISTGAAHSVSELIQKHNEAQQAAGYEGASPAQPFIVTGANESVDNLIRQHEDAQLAAEHKGASPARPSIVTGASESVGKLTQKHNEAQQASAKTGVSTPGELKLPVGEIKRRGQLFEAKAQNVTPHANSGHASSQLDDAKVAQNTESPQANIESPQPAAVTYDQAEEKDYSEPDASATVAPGPIPYITSPALSDAEAQQDNISAYLAEVTSLDELITGLNTFITENLDATHLEENIIQMIANHTAYKGDLQILTTRLPQVTLENPQATFPREEVVSKLNKMGTDLDTMLANINKLVKAGPSQNVVPPAPLIPVNPVPVLGAPLPPTLPTPAPPYTPPAQPQTASRSNILLRKLPPPDPTNTVNPYQNTKNISSVVDKLSSTSDIKRAQKLMDYLSTKLDEATEPGQASLVIRQKLVNEWNNKLYPLLEKINTRMTNLRDASDMLPPKDRGKLKDASNAYHEYAQMYDKLYAKDGIRDTLQTTLDTHGMESVRVKADELIKIDRMQGESESQFQSRITAECNKLFQPQTPAPQFSVSSANLDMNLITQAAIAVIKGDPTDAKKTPLHSSYNNNTYYSIETGATHTTNCEIKMKKIRDDLDYPRVLADIAMQHGFDKYLPLTQPVSRDQVKDFFTGFKENPPTKDGLNQFFKEHAKAGNCTIKTGRFSDSAQLAEIVATRYIAEVRDSKNKDVCSQKTMAIALDMIQNFSNISGGKEKITIAGSVNMEEIKRASKLICEVMKADLKDPAQKWRFDYKTFPRETKPEKFSSSAINRTREILKDIDPQFMKRLQLMDIGVSKVEKNREVEKVTGKFAVAHSDAGIKSDSEETTYQPRRPK
jgi:hypothetical protein